MTIDHALGLEHTFATQLEGLYVPWTPTGFANPDLVLLNRPLARALGIDPARLEAHAPALLSGSEVVPGSHPLAQAYAGHQFGQFNPQLGDGRAVLLGEVVAPDGHRYDIQLKGAGTTPFSRRGDGRAALDSALREYIVSEAMHALGIPSTRSLAVVSTGETIVRQEPSPGAVLTRVAASHLRIGTLEFFSARKEADKLQRLVDYAVGRHYPEHAGAPNAAPALLNAVAEAQGRLIARWMLVGFVHGVMNTDNVTLCGETIDYGPCAFIDAYDPRAVFSQIDHQGRYAYANQPGIGGWNLARMAEALLDLLAEDEKEAVAVAQASLERYRETFAAAWLDGLRAKLGLPGQHDEDPELAQALLDWMHDSKADFTGTFRALSDALRHDRPAFDDAGFVAWNERWRARLGDADRAEAAAAMDRVNPVYIPRNHKVEEALEAALQGDLKPTETLVQVLERPFEAQPGREAFAQPAPQDFGPYQTHCNT